jgi:hypothetical protein
MERFLLISNMYSRYTYDNIFIKLTNKKTVIEAKLSQNQNFLSLFFILF